MGACTASRLSKPARFRELQGRPSASRSMLHGVQVSEQVLLAVIPFCCGLPRCRADWLCACSCVPLPLLLPSCCRADDGHEASHSVLQGHQCLHTHDDHTVSLWQELYIANTQQHADQNSNTSAVQPVRDASWRCNCCTACILSTCLPRAGTGCACQGCLLLLL